jgi:CPA2 family monovalent cation:H+ antiporter-2
MKIGEKALCLSAGALSVPMTTWAFSSENSNLPSTKTNLTTTIQAEDNTSNTDGHTEGLIADLAWILLLGAVATIIFKKLRQPVILGYILAGFLASPKFTYLPSISNLENIDFWAELGIVVLMFTLGLEFSFKKLIKSGSDAIIPALVIIVGMTFAGFGVGKLLHMDAINSIFLGGMISMSSTTIILKALTDLGLRQKKFASLVLAVLILEDLMAVLMLVLLSSIAVGNVEGKELFFAVAKLLFFLVIWFVIGVYLLPQIFTRTRTTLNNETLLVISMGLCFGMAVFSVYCGFSLELGAFVTGSVLAGTILAERIEKVVQPIKDLFGAIFFISVGMMVDPHIIIQYWPQIILLAVVVIIGMILFGTIGMLLSGQTLRIAIESGFTLTQIGEFSFIIATLGMSLGVLSSEIYPIIVAVSVITIFTTPYFIKLSQPAYQFIERHLPKGFQFLIERYSEQSADTNETKKLWRSVLTRYLTRVLLYSAILIAIILVSKLLLFPLMDNLLQSWGKLASTVITLAVMAPFLGAMLFRSSTESERMKLHATAAFYDVPLMALTIIRYLVVFLFIVYFISFTYGAAAGWLVGAGCYILILIAASKRLRNIYRRMEDKFMQNLNVRENTRLGVNNNIVSDLHLAYIEVGYNSPFVGDRLKSSGLRQKYGVSVSSIQRGMQFIALPDKDIRIFPGDVLGVIGTDEQIKRLNDDIETFEKVAIPDSSSLQSVELVSVKLSATSPLLNKKLSECDIPNTYNAMLIKLIRGEEHLQPLPEIVLCQDDLLWLVGNPKDIEKIR